MGTVRAGRILALESVRGLAAFAVVLSHLVMAFAEPYKTGRPANIESLPAVVRVPLDLLYRPVGDGQFAVMVFFVLSGVVLSQSYLYRGRFSDLTSGIVRRYPRLAFPAIVSAIISCALWQAGLMHNHDAARLLNDADIPTKWLDCFQQDQPKFTDAVYQSGYEIFFARETPATGKMYNSVLWTMRTELYGSILIFGLLGMIGKTKHVGIYTVFFAVLLAAIGQTRLALFPAGMVLAVLRRDCPNASIPKVVAAGMLLAAFYLCGCYTLGDFEPRQLWASGFGYVISEQVCGLAGILLVAVVLFVPSIDRFLEWPPFCWLGQVSFGLYLVHLPIILSLGTYLFTLTYPQYGQAVALLLSSAAVIAVALPGAWLMFHLADRPAVWIGKQLSNLFERINQGAKEPIFIPAHSPLPSQTLPPDPILNQTHEPVQEPACEPVSLTK